MSSKSPPPLAVLIAACLYALLGVFTAIRIFAFGGGLPSSVGAWTAWVLAFAYFLLVAGLLLRRRNWVRWWATALAAIALVVSPWEFAKADSFGEQLIYMLQLAINAVLAALLFTPAARRWFRPNNSFKPTPLRGAA
jgi:hypothetical protein